MALDLYEWNAEISAALLRDLAHLEVGLRNAYDRALSAVARTPALDHGQHPGLRAVVAHPSWSTSRRQPADT
ncbi:hypothetical protein GCM10023153_01750 [Ornithinibacter aureus]|uniref:Uncharacterized protein n=1 Tax=Ornithinibacter aureus TaxID=622664 RepID=A0ABP8J9X2_9MICO|nr:hypothetical protein [Ornithinibacter aureus]